MSPRPGLLWLVETEHAIGDAEGASHAIDTARRHPKVRLSHVPGSVALFTTADDPLPTGDALLDATRDGIRAIATRRWLVDITDDAFVDDDPTLMDATALSEAREVWLEVQRLNDLPVSQRPGQRQQAIKRCEDLMETLRASGAGR